MRSLLVLVLCSSTALAAPEKDPYAAWRGSIAKIVARSFEPGALAQLTELGDTFGSRVAGSPGYVKAAEWAAAQLRAAGAQNVHFEKFKLEHGWQRGTATAAIVGSPARPLHIASYGWSPSTAGTVRGEVVIATFDAIPAKLTGKIVVVRRKSLPPGVGSILARRKAMADIKAAGGIAMLVEAAAPNNVLAATTPFFGGKLSPLPGAAVGQEDTAMIGRLAERGPVTLELQITNTITGPIEVANVIGELPGKEASGEWLLLGAHLDSWDFATGSSDNGSGVIQVLQAARALAVAGPLRRTVRFALFGAEEPGGIGSMDYVVAHAAELDKCVAMLNADSGAEHVRGWRVQGRKDVEASLAPVAQWLLASLGGDLVDPAIDLASDTTAFASQGVPVLDLSVQETIYELVHHTQADTVDKINAHALASGVSVIAVTAYALGISPTRFAARLDRAAVESQLKPSGIDALLRAEGWWK